VIGEAPLAMDAGWVERSETHRIMRRTGWVSLRSYELIRTEFTENIMTTQRFLVVLTLLNLALLVFLLTQTRLSIGALGVRLRTNADHSVLRGRALEIVDELNDRNTIGTMASISHRLCKSEIVFLAARLSMAEVDAGIVTK